MIIDRYEGVVLATRANVYFDGRCVSHGFTLADGSRKSVGVILPSELTFATDAPEKVEGVAGACEVLLPGAPGWVRCAAGESFEVPGQSGFRIRVTGEPYHYVCHFG